MAAEPPVKLRPKPRAYILPVEEQNDPNRQAQAESNDAWLDALGGVVKRVPVMAEDGLVIDHVPVPIINGRIEGGAPDKVLFYRCPDDALRGFRVHAGDLLLTVPAGKPEDDQLMLIVVNGQRQVRKLKKLDGGRLLLQSFDREFETQTLPVKDVLVLGKCVKLERRL